MSAPQEVDNDIENCQWVHGLCNDCKWLATDTLRGFTQSNPRWNTISSSYTTVTYATSHLDGSIEGLRQSAERGCRLCRLIYDKVVVLKETRPWMYQVSAREFAIAVREFRLGSISHYLTQFPAFRAKLTPSLVYQRLKELPRGILKCLSLLASEIRSKTRFAPYHIFFRGKVPSRCEFQVALADTREFVGNFPYRQPTQSLALFRQVVATPKRSGHDFEHAGLTRTIRQPHLPYLPTKDSRFLGALGKVRRWHF